MGAETPLPCADSRRTHARTQHARLGQSEAELEQPERAAPAERLARLRASPAAAAEPVPGPVPRVAVRPGRSAAGPPPRAPQRSPCAHRGIDPPGARSTPRPSPGGRAARAATADVAQAAARPGIQQPPPQDVAQAAAHDGAAGGDVGAGGGGPCATSLEGFALKVPTHAPRSPERHSPSTHGERSRHSPCVDARRSPHMPLRRRRTQHGARCARSAPRGIRSTRRARRLQSPRTPPLRAA